MADSTHTLEIKTTLRDGLSGPLRRAGDEARAVGQKATQGMAQAEGAARRTGRAFETAFGGGLKRGLGSMAIGISSAASASQGLEKSALSVGMNLAASFAMGGPVGLGIAALSTGIGALIGKLNEAEEAGKRFAAGISDRISKAADSVMAMDDAVKKSNIRLAAVKAGKDPGRALREADLDEQIVEAQRQLAEKDKLIATRTAERDRNKNRGPTEEEKQLSVMTGRDWREGRDKTVADQDKSLIAHGAERTEMENRLKGLTAIRGNEQGEETAKKTQEADKKAAEDAERAADKAAKAAEQRKEEVEKLNLEYTNATRLLQAQSEEEKLLVEQEQRRTADLAKGLDLLTIQKREREEIKDLQEKQAADAEKAAEKQAEETAHALEKAQAIADAKTRANEQSQYELDITKATTNEARLRVQQQHELTQARREGLDLIPIEKRHTEELLQLHAKASKEIEEKTRAEQKFIDKLQEEAAIAGAKDEKARQALEQFYARKKALEAAAEKGPEAAAAQEKSFKDQDKRTADADRAAKNDPLKGWNADMGMGPLAYLRQQKKDARQRKKWERTAASLRSEARNRMGITVGEDGGGWGFRPGDGDMGVGSNEKKKGDDSTITGWKPAGETTKNAAEGDAGTKIADSVKNAADAAKAQAESLGKAAEATQSMATEATAAKDAAVTTTEATNQSRDALKETSSAMQDTSTAAKDASAAASEVAAAAKNLTIDIKKMKDDLKKIKDALLLT